MDTSNGNLPSTDNSEGSQARIQATESAGVPPRSNLLAAIAAGLLLFVIIVGMALLLLVSLLVVYATSLAARWLDLPGLHVMLTFLGLVALVLIALLGARIGSVVTTACKQIERAVEEGSERVADEVCGSLVDVANAIDELPAVVVDPRGAPRAGERHGGPAVTPPHGGGPGSKASPFRGRR